jgi:hypothetical protein
MPMSAVRFGFCAHTVCQDSRVRVESTLSSVMMRVVLTAFALTALTGVKQSQIQSNGIPAPQEGCIQP